MPSAQSERPIYCEKCENLMEILGESFLEERRAARDPKKIKKWITIYKCKRCNLYKDIPKED